MAAADEARQQKCGAELAAVELALLADGTGTIDPFRLGKRKLALLSAVLCLCIWLVGGRDRLLPCRCCRRGQLQQLLFFDDDDDDDDDMCRTEVLSCLKAAALCLCDGSRADG